MILKLTEGKKYKIKHSFRNILSRDKVSTKELAKFKRKLVVNFPAVTFRPLHYKYLVLINIKAIKFYRNNCDEILSISEKGKLKI